MGVHNLSGTGDISPVPFLENWVYTQEGEILTLAIIRVLAMLA